MSVVIVSNLTTIKPQKKQLSMHQDYKELLQVRHTFREVVNASRKERVNRDNGDGT